MKTKPHPQFKKIAEISRYAKTLEGISHLLDWDQETYMPPGGFENRSEQLKIMAGLIHKERTGKKFATALSKLIDLKSGKIVQNDLSNEQEAAVKEWRREYKLNASLPAKFVESLAKLTSQAIGVWREAKNHNNFKSFAPYLTKIIEMNRKKADYLGYKDHPYDALLDLYEPALTTKEVATLFKKVRDNLTPLIKKIASKKPPKDDFLFGKWDQNKQLEFGWLILDAMGYDKKMGRLDLSSHPFSSSSHPTDSRITTRIHPTSLMSNILVVLHEGGHSLYEMGLPHDLFGTPLGESRSLGIHESQSRWWETRIGLSKAFWQHFLPILKKTFKGPLEKVSFEDFYHAINKVTPSFIRVEADELTYPLHVILRFELEKQLIEGKLKVKDLPEAWNEKMKDYLGICPKTDKEGCLQDIHWSMGAFGYFPTYTMGNLYAAHLFKAFEKKHKDWEKKVAKGELAFVREWLSEHIYRHGKRYSSHELLENATKTKFSADPYIDYLSNKYSNLYKL